MSAEVREVTTEATEAAFVSFVRRHNLEVPALFLLELQRSLGFFTAQFLIFLDPFLTSFSNRPGWRDWLILLDQPAGIERLIGHLQLPVKRGEH